MTELLTFDVADDIATITLDDGKANAFSHAMMRDLSDALDQATTAADITVIRGRKGILCGGFDLKVIQGDASQVPALVQAGARLLMKAWMHPQPLLIGVTGHAVAAGALLALTGDHRIGVTGDFRIGLNETTIGLELPVFAIELASACLDRRALSQATIGARLYSPHEAVEVGYLDQVAVPGSFDDALQAAATRLKQLDGPAVAKVKQRLRGAAARRSIEAQNAGSPEPYKASM
ncbi:MAG: crotonase/enoyl-CoA hydratase family protein [Minwuia sp.]|nr:crotonase/enoyl-CoA hydratase family protein [Minwuia sp.]